MYRELTGCGCGCVGLRVSVGVSGGVRVSVCVCECECPWVCGCLKVSVGGGCVGVSGGEEGVMLFGWQLMIAFDNLP